MDMNIKGVEKELVGRAKVAAFTSGQSLKAWVISAVKEALSGDETGGRNKRNPVSSGRTAKGVVTIPSGDSVVGSESSGNEAGGRRDQHNNAVDATKPKTKKLTAEEFFKLSNSDQDRARREKRY